MKPVLLARGLSVGRGAAPVLSGIDLAVFLGERLALVGANGSGKTTLLRALAGLDAPRAGSISWFGGALPRGAERTRAVGVLFQNEVPSRFTVRELVTLGLGLDSPPSATDRAKVEAALGWARLEALADRPASQLSGGETQRALLARARVASPRLLLLDEPTNHLDPALQGDLLSALEDVRGEAAVILATHDLALAATCDRVALLGKGGLLALGPPRHVLTPEKLALALGARVRAVEDPVGGALFFQVLPMSSRRGEARA